MTLIRRLRRSHRPGALLAAAVLAFVVLSTSAWLPLGQSQPWSQPIALSPDLQTGWFPDIAADATGRVHATWYAELSGGVPQVYDTVVYSSSLDGVSWATPKDIVALPSKGAITRATLLADDQGWLHLAFRSYTLFYSHVPAQAVDAANMLPMVPISTPDDGYFSRMAMDAQGHLHLVFTEDIHAIGCPGCFHLFYRRSDDRGLTWSNAIDLSRLATGAAKPQLLVDTQNKLHVVWESGVGGDLGQLDQTRPTQVMYASSADGGQTWAAPMAFAAAREAATPTPSVSPTPTRPPAKSAATATAAPLPTLGPPVVAGSKNIALGLGRKGQLVVAWLSVPQDRVYYQVSDDHGQSWSEPQLIAGVWGGWTLYEGRTDDYAMASDSAGVIHLALVGRLSERQETLSVLHVSWDGTGWSGPEAITTLRGDAPEWPRLAVSLGNQLHAAWFVRDQAHIFSPTGARYRVWYSQRRLDSAPLRPAVWPTLVPAAAPSLVPTTTPAATLAPTATPVPPGSLALSASSHPRLVYKELDYLRLVGLSLIPAGLGLALIVIVVRLLHR